MHLCSCGAMQLGAQIDAHSRFGRHWDSALIGWLADAEAASASGRAVLSTYPPGYEVQHIGRVRPKLDAESDACLALWPMHMHKHVMNHVPHHKSMLARMHPEVLP